MTALRLMTTFPKPPASEKFLILQMISTTSANPPFISYRVMCLSTNRVDGKTPTLPPLACRVRDDSCIASAQAEAGTSISTPCALVFVSQSAFHDHRPD